MFGSTMPERRFSGSQAEALAAAQAQPPSGMYPPGLRAIPPILCSACNGYLPRDDEENGTGRLVQP